MHVEGVVDQRAEPRPFELIKRETGEMLPLGFVGPRRREVSGKGLRLTIASPRTLEITALESQFRRVRQAIMDLRIRSGSRIDSTLLQLDADITALEAEMTGAVNSTLAYEERVRKLQKRVDRLTKTPLQHAVFVGKSARHDDRFVISLGGSRYEVGAALDAGADEQDRLKSGVEVLVAQGSHVIVGLGSSLRRGETAEVRDVIKRADPASQDRLLIRWGGGDGLVVDMASGLADLPETAEPPALTRPRAGDHVLVDVSARLAFEKLTVHETRDLELTKDPVGRYEDIAGLDEKIELIRDAIELPYLERKLFEIYQLERPHGILLFGPPGCGKTMIGRAVANGLKARIIEQLDALIERVRAIQHLPAAARGQAFEVLLNEVPGDVAIDRQDLDATIARLEQAKTDTRSYFLNVKGPELLSKWVGEGEHRIRQVFAEAKRQASYTRPVIIFFDEIESMFQRRGSGISSDLEKTMVPQLLAEIDGVDTLENVIVIGASNRPELLDPALLRPGRLDSKIKIDRPDRQAAAEIFRRYLGSPTVPLATAGPATPPDPAVQAPDSRHTGALEFDTREQCLDALIELGVDALFGAQNVVRARVLSRCDAEHVFFLREFVSGALIHNVVSRAKRHALKRHALKRHGARDAIPQDGIGGDDMLSAIREEYEENKEQVVVNKPEVAQALCDTCKRRHSSPEEYEIDVILGRTVRQRWHGARRPIGAPRSPAATLGGPS